MLLLAHFCVVDEDGRFCFGTHSLRRGGASAYLMAGMPLSSVALHGRWKGELGCVRLYVEPGVSAMLQGMTDLVCKGRETPTMVVREPPREDVENRARVNWLRAMY